MKIDVGKILERIEIFEKGRPVPGFPSLRQDDYGAFIRFPDHGKNSLFGYQEDHIQTKASGGSDSPDNKRPLHWLNNARRGDDRPFSPYTSAEQLRTLLMEALGLTKPTGSLEDRLSKALADCYKKRFGG
jgi:hypothetical protein